MTDCQTGPGRSLPMSSGNRSGKANVRTVVRARFVALAGVMLTSLAAGCDSDSGDVADLGASSTVSSTPTTPATTSPSATCIEMPAIDVSGPLGTVRTTNDQAASDQAVAELDALVGAAMVGVCTDAAVEWCESQQLSCPILVSDGVVVAEPTDDENPERFFLTEADGAVTGAAIDYNDLPEVPGRTE